MFRNYTKYAFSLLFLAINKLSEADLPQRGAVSNSTLLQPTLLAALLNLNKSGKFSSHISFQFCIGDDMV